MNAAFEAPEVAWAPMVPLLLVLGAGVIGILVEAFAPRTARRPVQLGLALVAIAGALVSIAALWTDVRVDGGIEVLGGSLLSALAGWAVLRFVSPLPLRERATCAPAQAG